MSKPTVHTVEDDRMTLRDKETVGPARRNIMGCFPCGFCAAFFDKDV